MGYFDNNQDSHWDGYSHRFVDADYQLYKGGLVAAAGLNDKRVIPFDEDLIAFVHVDVVNFFNDEKKGFGLHTVNAFGRDVDVVTSLAPFGLD